MTRFLKAMFWLFALTAMSAPSPVPTGSVSLAWDRVTDSSVTQVRIYYGEQSRQYEGFFPVAPNHNTCTVSGLELGHEYFFSGTAVNPAGESPYSAEVHYTFDGLPKPKAPAPLVNFGTDTTNQ